MLRIAAPGRVEDPRWTAPPTRTWPPTVLLAAGLDAIERGLDPGEPDGLNLYETDEARRVELGIEVLRVNLLDATRRARWSATRCCGPRSDARDEDCRLLRALQAARVAAGARADYPVGDRSLPAAVLT